MVVNVFTRLIGLGLALLAALAAIVLVTGLAPGAAGVFSFDPGSAIDGTPVIENLSTALAITVPLTVTAFLIAFVLGAAIGLMAGLTPGATADRLLSAKALVLTALPPLGIGLILVLVFSVLFDLVPTGIVGPNGEALPAIRWVMLPALAIALPVAGSIALAVRDGFAAIVTAPHVAAARARGMRRREALLRHGMRPLLAVLFRVAAVNLSYVFVVSLFMEPAFFLPGIGRLLLSALVENDNMVLRAVLMLIVVVVIALRLVHVLLAPLIDGRPAPAEAS